MPKPRGPRPSRKVVLLTIGGVRRQETFSQRGLVNIPHLFNELLPQSLFYPYIANEGTTSHFISIASMLTGVWQHVDDWGNDEPANPTLFHYLQSQLGCHPNETWVVTSNKQLTGKIAVGSNVILAKQFLIEAVERIIQGRSSREKLDRDALLRELVSLLDQDYERIGWDMPFPSAILDPGVKRTLVQGLNQFIHGPEAPATGDELTFFIASEVLKQVKPALLMMNFTDVEVAHAGVWSLHLGGIRRFDRLCARLWKFLQTDPEYAGRTTFVIVPEFGRDPDGSSTNGFFNHRTNTESCRLTWMMVLGQAVRRHEVVERVVRHIDVAPSLGGLFGVECRQAKGEPLKEFAV